MPGFDHGVQRGFDAVVGALIFGIVSGALVPSLVDAGLLPAGLFQIVVSLSIFSTVMTVNKSRYWSFAYLGGFVVGVFFSLPLLSQTQFIGRLTGSCTVE